MSDIERLERWRVERDASAFSEIVTDHSSMVYATCRRILGNTADAEDLTQECFLRLSKDEGSITESLGGWLHTLATRRSISLIRSEQRRRRRERRYGAAAPSAEESTWDDVQVQVDECISELPGELRDPIIAHFLERRTQQAIAASSGISKSAVSRRIEKGVAAIRTALQERGVPLTSALLATMLSTKTTLAAPTALSASLGRIAIVGAKATNASNATLLGGSIVSKYVAAIAIVTLAAVPVTFMMFPGEDKISSSSTNDVAQSTPIGAATTAAKPLLIADEDSEASGDVDESLLATGEISESVVADAANAGLGDLVIAGVVNDEAGDPIEGVFVQAFGGGSNPYTTTDSAGVFRLTGLADGLYTMRVQDDVHTGESLMGIRAGQEDLVVVLRDLAVVSGTIVNAATGSAITSFEMLAVDGIQGQIPRTLFSRFDAFNDNQGRFQVENVSLGESTLVVRAGGYAPAFEPLHLASGEPVKGLVIALQPGSSADGLVVNSAGETVSGAWVFKEPLPARMLLDSLVNDSAHAPTDYTDYVDALSDVEGRFAIDTFTTDDRSVAAFHPAYGYGEAALSRNGSGLADLRIVLLDNETGSIEITVTTAGEPGDNSVVWVGAAGGFGAMLQRGNTDGDGRCRLDHIPPGTWGVTAVYPGQTSSWQRRIVTDCEVVSGQTTEVMIDFDVASASLKGIVTLDGESAIGGNITLVLDRQGHGESETNLATWGDDGTFTIVDIVPGAGTLGLRAVFDQNRVRSKSFDIEFVESEQKVIEIDLSGGRTLTGFMYGLAATEHGSIAVLNGEYEIVEVSLESMAAIRSHVVGAGTVANDGSFSVEGLEPGIYTILAMVTKTRNSDAFNDVRWTSVVVEVSDTEDNTVDFDMK